MKSIEAYQVIALLMKNEIDELRIKAYQLNRLHKLLLNEAVRSDFSRVAFENMAMEYPDYIKIFSNEIIIYRDAIMLTEISTQFNILDNDLNQQIIKLWQEIVKES